MLLFKIRSLFVPFNLVIVSCFGKEQYLKALPDAFQDSLSKWAFISYHMPSVAVIPGSFNRSAFDAPYESKISDKNVAEAFVLPFIHTLYATYNHI